MSPKERVGSNWPQLHASVIFLVLILVVLSELFLTVLPVAKSQKDSATQVTAVNPGTVMRRELAPNTEDTLTVSIESGKLLRLLIEKGDLALSVRLYGPTGEELFEQISHEFGVVEICLPIDLPGTYKFVLRSLERNGSPRSYAATIQPMRTVTSKDRKEIDGRKVFAEAEKLRADWLESSLRQSIHKYETAARNFFEAGRLMDAAQAAMRSGQVHFLLSEFQLAQSEYHHAAEIAAIGGDKALEAEALSETGLVYSYLGRNDLARQYSTRALQFFEAQETTLSDPGRRSYAIALSNSGEIIYSTGNLAKAFEQIVHAGKLFRDLQDRKGEARVHLFSSYIKGPVNGPQQAQEEILAASTLYQNIGDKDGYGRSLVVLGLVKAAAKGSERSIELNREAIEIFQTIGSRFNEGMALSGVGQAYENLNQYTIAQANYEQALRLFELCGGLDLATVALLKIARMHYRQNNLEQAMSYYRRCVTLSHAAGKIRWEAIALQEMASVYSKRNQRAQTLAQYRRLEWLCRANNDRRGQAMAFNNMGDYLLRIGEKKEAERIYRRALPLSEAAGDNGILMSTHYGLARSLRDLNSLDAALAHVKRAVRIIEDERTNVESPEFRASYFSEARKYYELLIDILMQLDRLNSQQGFAAAALVASENSRARMLIDLLGESGADFRRDAPPKLLAREKELQSLLRVQAEYEMSERDPKIATEASAETDRLRSEYQEIQALLRNHSRILPLRQTVPVESTQIQNDLRNEDTVVLEYFLGDERSYLWLVTADSLSAYTLPSRSKIEADATEFYELLTVRQQQLSADATFDKLLKDNDRKCNEKAHELSQTLLGPVADKLGKNRLLIISEGALQTVPFEALVMPGNANARNLPFEEQPFLIETNEIIVLPSVGTLFAIRAEKRRVASEDAIVAILADPVFSSRDERIAHTQQSSTSPSTTVSSDKVDLPDSGSTPGRDSEYARLLHAAEEADAIVAVAPRGSVMVAKGFDASRETAIDKDVSRSQIVHFATHSRNSQNPESSGIVLTMVNSEGRPTNGFMSLRDIYGLNLSAEVTVLSACETALGKNVKGEGLIGLPHSFMSAGSKTVVASLWKVDDRATASLMQDFYTGMLRDGLSPSAALRQAKLKMMRNKRWNAPYFWAGFVFQGEYRNHLVVKDHFPVRFAVATAFSLIVIVTAFFFLRHRRRTLLMQEVQPFQQ